MTVDEALAHYRMERNELVARCFEWYCDRSRVVASVVGTAKHFRLKSNILTRWSRTYAWSSRREKAWGEARTEERERDQPVGSIVHQAVRASVGVLQKMIADPEVAAEDKAKLFKELMVAAKMTGALEERPGKMAKGTAVAFQDNVRVTEPGTAEDGVGPEPDLTEVATMATTRGH